MESNQNETVDFTNVCIKNTCANSTSLVPAVKISKLPMLWKHCNKKYLDYVLLQTKSHPNPCNRFSSNK